MKKGIITFQGTRGGNDAHETKMTIVGNGITIASLAHFQNQLKAYLGCTVRRIAVSEIVELPNGVPSVDANVDRAAQLTFTSLQDGATHNYRLPAPKASIVQATSSGDRVKQIQLDSIGLLIGAAMEEDFRGGVGYISQRK